MRLVQRIRKLDGVAQNLIQRQRTFSQPVCQRLPFQVLHDQKMDSILLPDVVQDAYVGMVQAGDGSVTGASIKPIFLGSDFDSARVIWVLPLL